MDSLWLNEKLREQGEGGVVYPCSQLLTLLLLRDQVLGGHLQVKLSQLMLPAHRSKKPKQNKKGGVLASYFTEDIFIIVWMRQ